MSMAESSSVDDDDGKAALVEPLFLCEEVRVWFIISDFGL